MKRTALILTLALLSGCSDEPAQRPITGNSAKVYDAIFASAKRALEGMPLEIISIDHVFKDNDGDKFLGGLNVREVGFPPRPRRYTLVIRRMCPHPTEQCWRIDQILADTFEDGKEIVTVYDAEREDKAARGQRLGG